MTVLRTIFGSFLRLPIVTVAVDPIAPGLVIVTTIFAPVFSFFFLPKSDVSVRVPFLTFL